MYLKENTELQGGKYRIVRFISKGGFGCTYEGIHTMMDSRVAIKEFFVADFCERDTDSGSVSVFNDSKTEMAGKLRDNFMREARAVFEMQHPGIVRVTDTFEENGTAYFVMDYIDGVSLHEVLKQRGPLSEQEAIRYIRQVADALKYVHGKHRLHLDIKPANIMLDAKGNTILIDFGASKHYDQETHEQTSTLLGMNTAGYAPPEQVTRSFTSFNPATDLYALGATLYKLLTGTTPPDSVSLLSRIDKLPPLPEGISDATRLAIEAAMQPKRCNRVQSVDDFLAILDGADFSIESSERLFGNGAGTPPPGDTDNTVIGSDNDYNYYEEDEDSPRKRNRIKILIALIAVLVIAIGVVGYVVVRGSSPAVAEDTSEYEEEEEEDPIDYEAIYQAQCDSLYKNFTTPSLKFAQVKGFVKSIAMTIPGEYGSTQDYRLSFDKEGKIKGMSHEAYGEWKNCRLSFNNDGYPIAYSCILVQSGDDKEEIKCSFRYSDGIMVSFAEKYGNWENSHTENYSFSGFNEFGLPTSTSYSSEGGGEGGQFKNTGLFKNTYKYDDFGNWIRMSENGSITCTSWADMPNPPEKIRRTEKKSTTIRRTITYYTPEEIDFSKFITKGGKQ